MKAARYERAVVAPTALTAGEMRPSPVRHTLCVRRLESFKRSAADALAARPFVALDCEAFAHRYPDTPQMWLIDSADRNFQTNANEIIQMIGIFDNADILR
jgi:hypothetical protein